ncbi:hydroxypyruvate isomerase [Hydrogenophaga sp.]|jgi:hydroxypyruvate isomerase|uniref:hydroxypyruvate isomerase n=1 Tax=Hydrogenophaga sp. TaxID=1904254 RepID=UPI003F6E7E2A
MPRFAANLSMLFGELPFLDRFEAAARAGFRGVEYLFPYDFDARELAARLSDHGLEQVLHNLPAGDWAAGERGVACIPGREAEFRTGVDAALRYAQALGCRQLNCLAGIAPTGVPDDEVRATLRSNLRHAAREFAASGIRLLVEAINTRDIPGFYVNRTTQARALIEDIDNAWLQYDIYHMQIMEGDLARTLETHLDRIAHVQLADNPGRHEPGSGEINYPFLFRHLDTIGYDGWVGCEYKPSGTTTQGLGWLAASKEAA